MTRDSFRAVPLTIALLAGCGGEEGASRAPAATAAAPAAPATTALAVGAPATVRYPGAPAGVDAESVAQSLTLTIAQPGAYQCNAHAEGMDAQLAIRRDGVELGRDSDSGGNFDAQLTQSLAPGTYEIRVWEWQRRAAPITVRCIVAPAVAADALTVGVPATVQLAAGEGPAGQRELTLSVATAGPYTCDARAAGLDAQMALLQNGTELQQDSDSGDGTDARIARELSPGTYQVRVWEWMHRGTTVTVHCYPGLMPPGT